MQTEVWQDQFDERQQKEIALDVLYAKEFGHGTDGHNSKMIIAKMAGLLSVWSKQVVELKINLQLVQQALAEKERIITMLQSGVAAVEGMEDIQKMLENKKAADALEHSTLNRLREIPSTEK